MTEDLWDPFTSLRRSPLADLAVRQLHQRLLSGQWEVGARLPAETELAQQLGVGRSTVREAVRALAHAGLLETRQGSGTYVRARALAPETPLQVLLQRAAVLEVYEVRGALEVQAARLAASRRTTGDVAALRAGLANRDRARELAGDERFVEADLAFHRAVVAAAHNLLLAEMFGSFAVVLRQALVTVATDRDFEGVRMARTHVRLVDAIEAGDAQAAEQATRDHLDPAAAALRSMAGR